MVCSRQQASKTAHGFENSEKLFSVRVAFLMPPSECPATLHWCWFSKPKDFWSYLWVVTVVLPCSSHIAAPVPCYAAAPQLPKLPQVSGGILTPEHFGGALFHGSGWSSKNGHRCLSLKVLCTSEAAFPRGLVLVKEGHLHPLVPSILWASCNLVPREPCFLEAQSWRRHSIY